jgi:hypothetical protein
VSPGKEKGIWLLRKGQEVLILASLVYLTVSQVNILIEKEQLETDNKAYLSSVKLTGAGLLGRGLYRWLRRRKAFIDKSRFSIYLL